MGGALAAVERGFVQKEIADSAYAWQRAVEAGERKVVGVNCFETDHEPVPEILTIDPAAEQAQAERTRAFRDARDAPRAETARTALARAAGEDGNLMPKILDAVRAELTLGEIADTLRGVYGVHRESE